MMGSDRLEQNADPIPIPQFEANDFTDVNLKQDVVRVPF